MRSIVLSVAAFSALLVISSPAVAASSDSCGLDSGLLTAFNPSTASLTTIRSTHRAISEFMSKCPLGPVDNQSRVVFFSLLDREFNFNFSPVLKDVPAEQQEAFEEGLISFQYHLSNYLDAVIRPDDVRFKSTVLLMGDGPAIAALGPAVKADVLNLATNPSRRLSGFRGSPHYLQGAAFEALGIWVSPAERRFSDREKVVFAGILRAALGAIDGPVKPGMHHLLVNAVVEALANSDDPQSAAALRLFAERSARYELHTGELSKHALKAAEDVDKRSAKGKT